MGVGDCDLRAFLLLVGLSAGDHHQQPARRVEGEMFDVERDELGAPERGGEAEQQQRPVAMPAEGGGVELGEDLLER